MHFTTTPASVALAAALVPLASAVLDKPIISPEFPTDSLLNGLNDNLVAAPSTSVDWDPDWIPQDCKSLAEGAGFPALDIDTFDVNYNDCSDRWVLCRHKDADLTKEDIIDRFGRMPVGMRSYIRHVIAFPGGKSAANGGDNIQLNGPVEFTVFVHETGHSLDGGALDPALGVPFSSGQTWLDAYDADSAVTDSYGQTSQQENFAQMTVVALFDNVVTPANVTGGSPCRIGGTISSLAAISTIQPSWKSISHQFQTIQSHLGDKIIPGGTCTNRRENSEAVPKTDSAKLRRNLSPKPDVSLSNMVTPIKSRSTASLCVSI